MDKDLDKKEKKRKSFVKSKVKGNGKVTSLDSVRKKSKLKSQKHRQNINVYYSFLTIILLFCLRIIPTKLFVSCSRLHLIIYRTYCAKGKKHKKPWQLLKAPPLWR